MQWSGQYKAMERVKQRMLIVVPIARYGHHFRAHALHVIDRVAQLGLIGTRPKNAHVRVRRGIGRDEANRRADDRGLFTSFLMELLVYPAIYYLWRERKLIASATVPEAAASLQPSAASIR